MAETADKEVDVALADTMTFVPRPDNPTAAPGLREIDHHSVQSKLAQLQLSDDEYQANEAAWVGHFNEAPRRTSTIDQAHDRNVMSHLSTKKVK